MLCNYNLSRKREKHLSQGPSSSIIGSWSLLKFYTAPHVWGIYCVLKWENIFMSLCYSVTHHHKTYWLFIVNEDAHLHDREEDGWYKIISILINYFTYNHTVRGATSHISSLIYMWNCETSHPRELEFPQELNDGRRKHWNLVPVKEKLFPPKRFPTIPSIFRLVFRMKTKPGDEGRGTPWSGSLAIHILIFYLNLNLLSEPGRWIQESLDFLHLSQGVHWVKLLCLLFATFGTKKKKQKITWV